MTQQFSLDPAVNLDALIADILMGKSGPWPIPAKHADVLKQLTWHKGAAKARPLADIARKLDMPAREVKAAVKSLIEDFKVPIGGSRQEPYGYFLIVTPDDLNEAIRPLASEIESLARRVRSLSDEQRVAEIFGQVRANLEAMSA